MAIRDLTMQIEIANAQTTEFEEAAQQLKQEIKDLGKCPKYTINALCYFVKCFEIWIIITIVNQSTGEDHKIGEKKQLALIKDLKRQLLAEKSQNEKLSEKMAEIVIQESVTNEHAIQNETNQNLPLANSG